MGSLNEIVNKHELPGWISGNEIPDFQDILKENARLLRVNQELQREIQEYKSSERTDLYDKFTFPELSLILASKRIEVPGNYVGKDENTEMNLLELFYLYSNQLNIGVDNSWSSRKFDLFLFYNVAPSLLTYDLVEKVRVPGVNWQRMQTSDLGLKFLAQFEKDITETNKMLPKSSVLLPMEDETE